MDRCSVHNSILESRLSMNLVKKKSQDFEAKIKCSVIPPLNEKIQTN